MAATSSRPWLGWPASGRPWLVDDQRGQPTWTVDRADAIVRLVTLNAPFGVWHGTSQGETTWHGFTQ
ncbi:sugar nucleotide-binding protein [Knoellia sp. GCM10027209]|uniref:sugar nucleotide-binding protein n=1 Tax=Knoellia sp. GCM10027209 TaxID=3273396 RepID=UPI00361D5386